MPGNRTAGKGARIKGTEDPVHDGRRKGRDRDMQGETRRGKYPPRYPADHIFIINPLYICCNGNGDIREEKAVIYDREGKDPTA